MSSPETPHSSHSTLGIAAALIVDSVLENCYQKPLALERLQRRIVSELNHIPGSLPRVLKEVSRQSTACENDLPLLYPFLDQVQALGLEVDLPSPQTTLSPQDHEAAAALLEQEFQEGHLQMDYQADPKVRAWIRNTVERIRPIFQQTGEENAQENAKEKEVAWREEKQGKKLAQVLLGTTLLLYDSLQAVAERYLPAQREGQEQCVRVNCIQPAIRQIRRSLCCALLRESSTILEKQEHSFVSYTEELWRFLNRTVREDRVSLRSAYAAFRNGISRVSKLQSDMNLAVEDAYGLSSIPVLAERLHTLTEQKKKGMEQRVLPYGHVLLSLPLPNGEFVSYATDGRTSLSQISLSGDREEEGVRDVEVTAFRGQPLYYLPSCHSCIVMEEGIVAPTDAGRFATCEDPEYLQQADFLLLADKTLHSALLEQWEKFPGLFAVIQEIEPLFLLKEEGRTIILCPEDSAEKVVELLPDEADFAGTEVLRERGIHSDLPLFGFALRDQVQIEAPSPSKNVLESHNRSFWRSRLRKILGDRVPSFNWLVAHLLPFQVTTSTQGKGSHTSLNLHGHRDTISFRIRSTTESLPIGVLFSALERLEISYWEFVRSLGSGPHPSHGANQAA